MPETDAASSGSTQRSSELGRAARGGAITFIGAAMSASAGFLFSLLLARLTGPYDTGVVLQAVAVFTIVLALAKFGLDTTAVWMLPRFMVAQRDQVRPALGAICALAVVFPVVVVAAWLVVWFAGLGSSGSPLLDAVTLTLLFLPAASLTTVSLAATRAFGGVWAFNAVGNVVVPVLRPVSVVAVTALGGGALGIAGMWAATWVVGVALTMVILLRMVRRAALPRDGSWRPSARLVTRILSYSGPRAVIAGMEQSVIWLDVVLVGIILGAVDAGVYGAASRFVAAGVVALTALRIVVAPRFSALLAEARGDAVSELHTATAGWVLVLGGPIYIVLAVFAPTVLGWLGPGFGEGATAMVVLCVGSLVVLAAGNVQSLLLMSGRSGWGAVNKSVVVCFNVIGNLLLIPRVGITGAAVTWSLSMVLDTVLASWQVRRGLGISPAFGSIAATLLAVVCCVGAPSLAVVAAAGRGPVQLVSACALSGVVLAGYCFLDRGRLRLDEAIAIRRR